MMFRKQSRWKTGRNTQKGDALIKNKMGGEGSGRKANPVNIYTPTRVNLASPVGGTSYELPNLSGVRDGGTKSDAMKSGSGAVVFVNSDGDFATDSSNLYWDDTNKRLGIGTTTPGYELQINDTDGETNAVINLVGTTGRLRINGSNFISATATVTTLSVNGTEKSRFTTTGYGIGLTIPKTLLHLSGGAFTISNTTAPSTPVAAAAFFSSGGAMWVIGSSGTQTLVGPA